MKRYLLEKFFDFNKAVELSLLVIFVENIHEGSILDNCSSSGQKEYSISLSNLRFVTTLNSLEDTVNDLMELIEGRTVI